MKDNILKQIKNILLEEIENHLYKDNPLELTINIINNINKYMELNHIKLTNQQIKSMIVYLNLLLDENNINITIKEDDYKNLEKLKAKNKVHKYMNVLKKQIKDKEYKIDPEELDDIKFLLRYYDLLEERINTYQLLAKIYYNQQDLNMEYEYLTKAYGLMNRLTVDKINYSIIKDLIRNHILKGKYEEALRLYQRTIIYEEYISIPDILNMHYAGAVANTKSGRYEMALEIIFDILEHIKNQDYNIWYKTYLLKGVCYHKLTDYESAIIEYNKALQVFSFIGYGENKYIAYYNIILSYLKLEEYKEVYSYLEVLLNGVNELEINTLEYADLTNKIATIYEVLEEFKEAKKYYIYSLEACSHINKEDLLMDNMVKLLDIDKERHPNEKENIFDIIEKHINSISEQTKAKTDIILKILETYNSRREYERLDRLINKILKV